jgi:signal transduction histidine kinase
LRKNLLVQLTVAIFLPYLGGFLFAWAGYCQFEKTMEKVAASYVQNLAQGAAARLESSYWEIDPSGTWHINKSRSRIIQLNDLMPSGVNVPGFFAVFNKDGGLVYGPTEALPLAADLNQVAYLVGAQKVNGTDGCVYSVTVYPVMQRDLFVMAAVAWRDLLGPMVSLATFWPFITGLLGLIGIFSVYAMWQKVILPLKDLEAEISLMQWGEDVPLMKAPEAVDELQRLREAIVVLANSAIDKTRLSRRYVNDLVKVQEEERERISREIHDGPLQDVTAFIQRIRLIGRDDVTRDEKYKLLNDAESIALTGVREMRELCNNLTPPWLDLGIVQALTELSERRSEQLGIKIFLDTDEVGELPDEVTMAFFRVAQEAVNNSVQHGKATKVKISLKEGGDALWMTVEDDGRGFDVPDDIAQLRVRGHRGLSNMKERMSLVGGKLSITSSPGGGTVITAELPAEKFE